MPPATKTSMLADWTSDNLPPFEFGTLQKFSELTKIDIRSPETETPVVVQFAPNGVLTTSPFGISSGPPGSKNWKTTLSVTLTSEQVTKWLLFEDKVRGCIVKEGFMPGVPIGQVNAWWKSPLRELKTKTKNDKDPEKYLQVSLDPECVIYDKNHNPIPANQYESVVGRGSILGPFKICPRSAYFTNGSVGMTWAVVVAIVEEPKNESYTPSYKTFEDPDIGQFNIGLANPPRSTTGTAGNWGTSFAATVGEAPGCSYVQLPPMTATFDLEVNDENGGQKKLCVNPSPSELLTFKKWEQSLVDAVKGNPTKYGHKRGKEPVFPGFIRSSDNDGDNAYPPFIQIGFSKFATMEPWDPGQEPEKIEKLEDIKRGWLIRAVAKTSVFSHPVHGYRIKLQVQKMRCKNPYQIYDLLDFGPKVPTSSNLGVDESAPVSPHAMKRTRAEGMQSIAKRLKQSGDHSKK